MREVGDEQAEVNELVFLGPFQIAVGEKGDLGKCKKGDPDRKDDLAKTPIDAEQRIDIGDEKAGVLEIRQHGQIDRNPEHQPIFRETPFARVARERVKPADRRSDPEVPDNRAEEEKRELRHPVAIEGNRSEEKPARRPEG